MLSQNSGMLIEKAILLAAVLGVVYSEVSSVITSTPTSTTSLNRQVIINISQSISPGTNTTAATPTSTRGVVNTNSSEYPWSVNITPTAARSTKEVLNTSQSTWSEEITHTSPTISTRPVHTSNVKTSPIWPTNERCEVYNGGPLCERWLRNETVYVDLPYTQEVVNSVAEKLLGTVDETVVGPVCTVMFKEAVCRYLYPSCTINGIGHVERARMCYKSCARLITDCGNSLLFMIAIVQGRFPTLWDNFNPNHVHLDDLACSRELLPSAASNQSCLILVGTIDEVQVSTCEATDNNSQCLLPFIYNGVEYDDCIFVNTFDSWRPWCLTNPGQGGKWGHCDCNKNNTTTLDLQATCELYSGSSVCEEYLHGTIVFIDDRYNQTYLGTVIDQFSKSFYDSQQNSRCVGPSLRALCQLLFPECYSSGSNISPLPLCYSSCTALSNGSCGSEFNEMMQTVYTYFQSHAINPVHFYSGQSICSKLPQKSNCADIGIDVPSPNKASDSVVVISVVVPIGCITLCIVVVLIWKWKRRKRDKTISVDQSEMYVDVGEEPSKTGIEWDDDIAHAILESLINGNRLKIAEQIGEGNFGRVFKGTMDGKTIVAVKSLKSGKHGGVDRETANSFVREALRMKHLDHPHVMKLIGISWATEANSLNDNMGKLISGPLILLPYTELGDLRGYLRKKRTRASSGGNPYVMYSNMSADIIDKEEKCPVPVVELVKFSYQIAAGMDYVSRQGIVHRDLAARNCMLTWDMNVKVSDFGLARVLEEGKDYYRVGQCCALPVRWMAPESIVDLVFTNQSDIWSYGVTLWEIFSFAAIPYPGLSNVDILPYILSGKHLSKPNICPDSLYDVMEECWKVNANDRPEFAKIVSALERNLSNEKCYLELQPDM